MGVVKIPYLTVLWLEARGALSTGDGKDKVVAPSDGEILEYGGSIGTLGTGAGTKTEIQVRNGTRDYFTSKPAFEVNAASNLLDGGGLIASPTFKKDDTLELDIDAISTGPENARIGLLCQCSREVEV
jgi:hypothetical protein